MKVASTIASSLHSAAVLLGAFAAMRAILLTLGQLWPALNRWLIYVITDVGLPNFHLRLALDIALLGCFAAMAVLRYRDLAVISAVILVAPFVLAVVYYPVLTFSQTLAVPSLGTVFDTLLVATLIVSVLLFTESRLTRHTSSAVPDDVDSMRSM